MGTIYGLAGLVAGMVGPFTIAFILIGIVYLTSWKRYPKWKARFWWVTFGVAGVIPLLSVLTGSSDDHFRGWQIMEFFIFMIVALIIWGIKRGKTTTATKEGDESYNNILNLIPAKESKWSLKEEPNLFTNIVCPKCGHQNEGPSHNCASCHVNLRWALENYAGQSTEEVTEDIQRELIVCPKCGHRNQGSPLNCVKCNINLQWAEENLRENLNQRAEEEDIYGAAV